MAKQGEPPALFHSARVVFGIEAGLAGSGLAGDQKLDRPAAAAREQVVGGDQCRHALVGEQPASKADCNRRRRRLRERRKRVANAEVATTNNRDYWTRQEPFTLFGD